MLSFKVAATIVWNTAIRLRAGEKFENINDPGLPTFDEAVDTMRRGLVGMPFVPDVDSLDSNHFHDPFGDLEKNFHHTEYSFLRGWMERWSGRTSADPALGILKVYAPSPNWLGGYVPIGYIDANMKAYLRDDIRDLQDLIEKK